MGHNGVTHEVEAAWRIESARLVAALTRMVGDVGLAEEFAQDALVAALEKWPEEGVPRKPGAWLTTVARRRVLDRWRRDARFRSRMVELGREVAENDGQAAFDAVFEEEYGDDLLKLMFVCCHPVLSTEARVALTLRLLGGLTTDEIARAFLVPEATVAQRVVRAKRKLSREGARFEVPGGRDRDARLSDVLEVLYLVFNEGYTATSGKRWLRPELCEEAMRLGRVLAGLLPKEPEVHGLVALMELQASRFRYHLLPAVRGDLLERLGRAEEAREDYARAAELTRNESERALLMERSRLCENP